MNFYLNLQLSENTSPFAFNLFRASHKSEAPDQATTSFSLLSETLTHFDQKWNRMENAFWVLIHIIEILFHS